MFVLVLGKRSPMTDVMDKSPSDDRFGSDDERVATSIDQSLYPKPMADFEQIRRPPSDILATGACSVCPETAAVGLNKLTLKELKKRRPEGSIKGGYGRKYK